MSDNVIEFGKRQKPEPRKPEEAIKEMHRFDAARALSEAFGITIMSSDAEKLHVRIQQLITTAFTKGAEQEREACAAMVEEYMKETENMEARGCLASVAHDIRARGKQ